MIFLSVGSDHPDKYFFGTALFSEKLFLHISSEQLLRHNRTVTFSDQLFLQSICFFLTVIFSEQLLFQGETSTEQPPLENRKFFRVATFRSSYLFGEGIVQNKDMYRRAAFLKQVPLHSINYFRRVTFWKKENFPEKQYYPIFLESRFFRVVTFSKDLIFYSSYFFRRATFL